MKKGADLYVKTVCRINDTTIQINDLGYETDVLDSVAPAWIYLR